MDTSQEITHTLALNVLINGIQKKTENDSFTVIDCNGNPLQNGDTIIVIKNLPVKGAPKPIKSGTKIKNIRLVDQDHNINCKIDGFGSMQLKSEFVRRS